ncbi:MAG: MotA/TolQ/ExbB proton channel family protein [Gammaproteobacteria bacterium]|nr:MotA/TolQ/ExbB proton channel family protein [Gammaproteobacteria bacterium]
MIEIVIAGGVMMIPIIAASILALAISVERLVTLRSDKVLPPKLLAQIWQWVKQDELDEARLLAIRDSSPLGRVLAAGLANRQHARDILKESLEDEGRQVAHELERFLPALGTVAAISPLLGLLGTVLGMITTFTAITQVGVGDPSKLASGISVALITTAAGLLVAIPSMVMHRYFRGKVHTLIILMEDQARMLVEALHGEREIAA